MTQKLKLLLHCSRFAGMWNWILFPQKTKVHWNFFKVQTMNFDIREREREWSASGDVWITNIVNILIQYLKSPENEMANKFLKPEPIKFRIHFDVETFNWANLLAID